MKKRLFIGSAILVSIFMTLASVSAPTQALHEPGASAGGGTNALLRYATYNAACLRGDSAACLKLKTAFPNGLSSAIRESGASSGGIFELNKKPSTSGASNPTSSTKPSSGGSSGGASGTASSSGSSSSTPATSSGGTSSISDSGSSDSTSGTTTVPMTGDCVKTAILFGGDEVCDDDDGEHIFQLLYNVVDIMTIGVGILGVIGITVAGIQYLTAGGSEEKTRKAKRRIFEIIIGLVVYALFYVILTWLNINPPSA